MLAARVSGCWLVLALAALPLAAAEFPELKNTEKSPGGPMAPAEVVRTAKLPPGFQLEVFAAEPGVQNPIAITTDQRGRVWVAENYSWAGAGAGGFDPQQRDRIVVLEDSDGDGRHDKRTVFHDDLHKLTSVEVGRGGVWAIALPKLLFFPDANGDDVPDGPPVVVLDGLDEGVVGHTPANGLKWGPDGWLYARHGIQATSRIGKPGASDSQRAKISTGVWRYHPERGVVEAVMHGMTNSWGFDFNEHGEMFVINTVIGHLWHVVPGAHVRRMYGIDTSSQHLYQLIEQTADHVHWDTGESWGDVRKGITDKTNAAGGGHAHIGLMIYQGDNWPAEYRGRVYTLNLHGRRINCDHLERQTAGYTAKHGQDFCFIADPWYRGMDLITGPDGGVFIADWSDTGECHDHDGVHRTSGRIYKLTYGTPQKVAPFDLAKQSDEQLVALQSHANDWWVRQARRVLNDRKAAQPAHTVAQAGPAAPGPPAADPASDPAAAAVLRDRWTRLARGAYGAADARADLGQPNEHVRVGALRLLVDELQPDGPRLPAADLALLRTLAERDPSGLVQLYLASSLQRLPLADRWPLVEVLATKADLNGDRMFPLMLWYGIEPAVPSDPARALAVLKAAQIEQLRQNIARRLTLDVETQPQVVEDLVGLAGSTDQPALARDIAIGMAEALRGWRKAPLPKAWADAASKLAANPLDGTQRAVQELNVVFGDGRAIDHLRAIVVDGNAEAEARRQALRALLAARPADLAPVLHNLLGDRVLANEALRGLAVYDHPDTPQQIFNRLGGFNADARAALIGTLASRPAYAKALLAALRDKKIAPNEVSAFHARQIRSFEDSQLTAELAALWGELRESAADKRALIERHKTELGSDVLGKADLRQGRALFNKTCANCHVLYGQGRKVGPDLTGSNRKNIDYLLENIVDPSATVGADFRAMLLTLADGRVLSGVIIEQNERTLTLQTAQDPVTLDRQEIDESKQSPNSLMPDGLMQNLSPEQVRDLIGYLMSVDQVPLPE